MTLMPHEELELRALVEQAFELKGSPYLRDACEAIEAWYRRRFLARYERLLEQDALVLRVLRDTAPERLGLREVAHAA